MAEATERLDASLVDEFRQRLAEARARLLRTVVGTTDELTTLEGREPGAPAEDVNRDVVAAVMSHLEGRERHELDEIHAAQTRLETGGYGICEVCARPIPLARLRAQPVARYCVACQAREEERG